MRTKSILNILGIGLLITGTLVLTGCDLFEDENTTSEIVATTTVPNQATVPNQTTSQEAENNKNEATKNIVSATEIEQPKEGYIECVKDVTFNIEFEKEFVKLLNNYRIENGLNPLTEDEKLTLVTKYEVNAMIQQDTIGKALPNLPLGKGANDIYGLRYLGKYSSTMNIPTKDFDLSSFEYIEITAKKIFDNCLETSSSRQAILEERFKNIGIGIAKYNNNGVDYYCVNYNICSIDNTDGVDTNITPDSSKEDSKEKTVATTTPSNEIPEATTSPTSENNKTDIVRDEDIIPLSESGLPKKGEEGYIEGTKDVYFRADLENELVDLINQYRAENGLAPLERKEEAVMMERYETNAILQLENTSTTLPTIEAMNKIFNVLAAPTPPTFDGNYDGQVIITTRPTGSYGLNPFTSGDMSAKAIFDWMPSCKQYFLGKSDTKIGIGIAVYNVGEYVQEIHGEYGFVIGKNKIETRRYVVRILTYA